MRLLILLLPAMTLLNVAASGAMARQAISSPGQQLADRFAPIAELRTQQRACGRRDEGYVPAPVELVLANAISRLPASAAARGPAGRRPEAPDRHCHAAWTSA